MARASPLTQILRTLTVSELRSLRRTYAPRVSEYDGDKDTFVRRLRNSLKRAMDDGEFNYEELMAFIREEFKQNGPQRASTRIRHSLNELVVSPNAGRADTTAVREGWICSEAFQVLRREFSDSPYAIEQEAGFGRSNVDLLVTHERENRNYIIEAKLAGSYSSRERLLSQLRRYRKKVPYLRRTYVLMVTENERDLPQNKDSVSHAVEEAENEPDTEVLIKSPESLLY